MATVLDVSCPGCGAKKGSRCRRGKTPTCAERRAKLASRMSAIKIWADSRRRRG